MIQERRRELGPRPQPGPIPVPEPAAGPGRRRVRHGRPHRLRRGVGGFFRSKQGRWTLVGLACLAVLLVGLLVQGFLAPAPSSLPDAAATGGLSLGPSAPGASSSAAAAKKSTAAGPGANDALKVLRAQFPDNPLNHLGRGQLHRVTISVSSPTGIPFVGYLVPTGLGSAYATVHPHSGHWSMSEQALGPGYLAAIFIQATKTGVPITCTVNVDGRVTDSQTTSGSYGRAVCLG